MHLRSWQLALLLGSVVLLRPTLTFGGCEGAYEGLSPVYDAVVVKLKDDGSRIYKLHEEGDHVGYYKETPAHQTLQHQIFDNPMMSVEAWKIAESAGLEKYVARTDYLKDGMDLKIDGKIVHTQPGDLQVGVSGLITPIDEFKKAHPGVQPTVQDIAAILNTGEWPRLYANWKIWWQITQQVDLNIENLSRMGNENYMYDLGDMLNLPHTRAEMGISVRFDNLDFILPNQPGARAEYRPDYRKADPVFRKLAKDIATESDEATAARLGMKLSDSFPPPRGNVKDHVDAMKFEARQIVDLLDKSPFDF